MGLASDMVTRVLSRLDELDPANPVHWSREEILEHVNDAIAEYQLITWELQGSAVVPIDDATNIYKLPSELFAISDIREDMGGNYLRRSTIESLDRECEWESPRANRLHVREWCPVGIDKFLIYPRPMFNSLTPYTLTVEGYAIHEPVLDDGVSEIPVKPEHEHAIEDWTVSRASFKEGGGEFSMHNSLLEDFLQLTARVRGLDIIRMLPKMPEGVIENAGPMEEAEDKEGVQ